VSNRGSPDLTRLPPGCVRAHASGATTAVRRSITRVVHRRTIANCWVALAAGQGRGDAPGIGLKEVTFRRHAACRRPLALEKGPRRRERSGGRESLGIVGESGRQTTLAKLFLLRASDRRSVLFEARRRGLRPCTSRLSPRSSRFQTVQLAESRMRVQHMSRAAARDKPERRRTGRREVLQSSDYRATASRSPARSAAAAAAHRDRPRAGDHPKFIVWTSQVSALDVSIRARSSIS